MTEVLWTDQYAPTLEELPQAHVRQYLGEATDRPINLLLHGPPGVGKTAAVRALARTAHSDPSTGLLELNVADFFGRTKREIEADPRFAGFLRDGTNRSKREMINHVFRESIAYAPVAGRYRTVLLDNAEAVREDFQQSLRRLIERHHQTTQFVLTTRQLGRVIPALQSRCLPVPMPAPSDAWVADRLATIYEMEGIDYERAAVDLLAEAANGNVRRAILSAQTVATVAEADGADVVTETAVFEGLADQQRYDAIGDLLTRIDAGDFDAARSILDDVLIEEGLDGNEILEAMVDLGRSRYDEATAGTLVRHVAETDARLATGGDDRVQLSSLLAELSAAP